jgi:hypothetical protein
MWRPFYGSKWDGCALLLRHIQAAWEMCYRPPVELTMPIHMFRKGQIEGIAKGNILTHNQFINQLFGVAASRALTTLLTFSSVFAMQPSSTCGELSSLQRTDAGFPP